MEALAHYMTNKWEIKYPPIEGLVELVDSQNGKVKELLDLFCYESKGRYYPSVRDDAEVGEELWDILNK